MALRGNLVVGQSGGPTAVINNSLVGIIHEAMQHAEIDGIYGMMHGITGIINEQLIDLRRESAATLEGLRNTPASALGTIRYKVSEKDYERIVEVLSAYNIRTFCYIGGNDSADTTHKVAQAAERAGYELCAIAVPKTVDNDLAVTDHCPGYGSAARFVATAIRATGFDTRSMGESGPIKLMEIMGRNAGWLAASAVLAREEPDDPPHLIYVPERRVSISQIVADVKACLDRHGYCVAALSEGLVDENGDPLGAAGREEVKDAFGHVRKGGVVETIEAAIQSDLKMTARYDKPNYLQRSMAELMSPVDREEAYEVGRAAVRAAVAGQNDVMITLVREPGPEYRCGTGIAPLHQVANVEHMLPPEYINDAGNGVTAAFVEYARPLIGGPLAPYARLALHPVPKRQA